MEISQEISYKKNSFSHHCSSSRVIKRSFDKIVKVHKFKDRVVNRKDLSNTFVMWKNIFTQGFKYNQPNASSKNLILSVLNTTATKREAKDYLSKYTKGNGQHNYCLFFIRDLHEVGPAILSQFSSVVKRLGMLGLRPMFVIPPSLSHVNIQAELLDNIVTGAGLRPLHLKEGLTKSRTGLYHSTFSQQSRFFDMANSNFIPIIKPYVYNEETASEFMTKDVVKFMNYLCQGDIPHIDKFFILNKTGGIPSGERNDNAHVFINLSQELKHLYSSLSYNISTLSKREPRSQNLLDRMEVLVKKDEISSLEYEYHDHLEDLLLMDTVLSNLAPTATGLITTTNAAALSSDRKNPLVYNLLTDRSLISSSLPRFKKYGNEMESSNNSFDDHTWYELPPQPGNGTASHSDAVLVTTVLKKGVHIKTYDYKTLTQFNSVGLPKEFYVPEAETKPSANIPKLDINKFKSIIDQSFKRSLDLHDYLNRINGRIATIIVIGDYEGIAILTYEGSENNPFVYLDKFAVLPHLKGSLGISDIIFNLMFKKFPNEILWRSRKDNVVNKWYFQRSVAVLDLSVDLDPEHNDKQQSQFKLFYYGNPQYAKKALRDKTRLREVMKSVRDIKPSWHK
ncbi:hypothetical protein SMKI_10G1370 [Saccharomyces mikatae IFO 1815]|uniref:Amino-acid acetyltransferase, mitochondrial n=1 Tax=Saccharomyces mikatae IFO 1815 TaxID=226126 RepID=A0AA35ND15_SACMI|nr:uncharacterized protein SMKI_10G1370 [Saccharomyces mikatae IFO 1815]CAI4034350.1 hypothetical protein SMKI_10G1370 [Saccharomyces mikatae IFO 1815]